MSLSMSKCKKICAGFICKTFIQILLWKKLRKIYINEGILHANSLENIVMYAWTVYKLIHNLMMSH